MGKGPFRAKEAKEELGAQRWERREEVQRTRCGGMKNPGSEATDQKMESSEGLNCCPGLQWQRYFDVLLWYEESLT